MEISFRCPTCQAGHNVEPATTEPPVSCATCDEKIPLSFSESILEQNVVDVCPCCGKTDFYIQRDFNQRVGLGIVIFFGLVGLIFVALDRPLYFYVSLGLGALVDLVFYLILPEITVCYACKTTFRATEKNPEHQPFDLHIADVYDNRAKG